MKYVSDFQDVPRMKALLGELHRTVTRPWNVMEICGGQTHNLMRHGLLSLLPENLSLVHGPGCPVCVTDQSLVDTAMHMAQLPDVIFCTFGDMVRVPGSTSDLALVRARGADVRVVESVLESLTLARQHPEKTVVFFGIGFETTACTFAQALDAAHAQGLTNWLLFLCSVRVPPAMEALLSDPENRLQGFLAAGHVCTVQGLKEYEPVVARFGVPVVATGFEPVDLLYGLLLAARQLESGRALLENAYDRCVKPQGNERALALVEKCFEPVDRPWRGMGVLPRSGLGIRPAFAAHDALVQLGPRLPQAQVVTDNGCQSGLVLMGRMRPNQCPHFGRACTPLNPLGATMVSSEGACQAYYQYTSRAAV